MNAESLVLSATASAGSVASAFAGDDIMAWVFLVINIITLLSNAGLSIYRKWRDRDDDRKE